MDPSPCPLQNLSVPDSRSPSHCPDWCHHAPDTVSPRRAMEHKIRRSVQQNRLCWARLGSVTALAVKATRVPCPWPFPACLLLLRALCSEGNWENPSASCWRGGESIFSLAQMLSPSLQTLPASKSSLKHSSSWVKGSHNPAQHWRVLSQRQTILTHFTPCSQGDFSSLEEKRWHWRAWFSFALELLWT